MTSTMITREPTTRFDPPDDLTATEPPEQRGLRRDGVRLLVADRSGITHTWFTGIADHLAAVLAVEHPDLRVYAFDPGDMRTAMHQAAFPREDISDRPEPAVVVPALVRLLQERPESGRYRAAELLTPVR